AWKIIRTPRGPGIDRGEQLILELRNAGDIKLSHEPLGPYTETVCILAKEPATNLLPAGAIDAIRSAYVVVKNESASQINEWSRYSRSWNQTPNGKELNIYNDLIPDDVYEERKQ